MPSADKQINEVNKVEFNFGNNLKRLRLSKKYTQEQVAEKLNVSSKAVSRWECGTAMPDVMLLPEIARLYCVTVDELYKDKSIAYKNYAQKLMSVYESTQSQDDFIETDKEFEQLIRTGNFTMNDMCMYAILYQQHMDYCKNKALELFEKGLNMGESTDPCTYHWIERQKMTLLADTGDSEKNIEACKKDLIENFEDVHKHINLIFAYFIADKTENAYETFKVAEKKFNDSALLFAFGGDVCKELQKYDEAFECWNKAIELNLNFTAAYRSKARCYEDLSDYENAYKTWCEIVNWYEDRGYKIEAEEARKCAKNLKEKYGL